jgi:hypothetical protein
MKRFLNKFSNSSPLKQTLFIAGITVAVGSAIAMVVRDKPASNYIAHEWGTFTSVQGGDGVLLDWRPLETSRLPGFVYDWNHPGSKRQPQGFGSKSELTSLQRMETPVIYFYSAEQQKVDVTVRFPKGRITEWYPQATEVGPSAMPIPAAVGKMDGYPRKAGVNLAYTFASLAGNPPIKESRIRWANINIVPEKFNAELNGGLPLDNSASHYFAARKTDSALLRAQSTTPTNAIIEHEKFLFYRGVGSFATPLRVITSIANEIIVANLGEEPLKHLFVLSCQKHAGKFIYIAKLGPGEQRKFTVDLKSEATAIDKLSQDLGDQIAASLVKEGLFEREARAMVTTWKNSWFEEEGMRVLYILPRVWTDRTLPLTIEPSPRELVRVMVGRSEIIPPLAQQQLTEHLDKAASGELMARENAISEFRKFGRFAEPALALATRGSRQEVIRIGWDLLHQANTKPAQAVKAL